LAWWLALELLLRLLSMLGCHLCSYLVLHASAFQCHAASHVLCSYLVLYAQ
jgi:hypothetical protein